MEISVNQSLYIDLIVMTSIQLTFSTQGKVSTDNKIKRLESDVLKDSRAQTK